MTELIMMAFQKVGLGSSIVAGVVGVGEAIVNPQPITHNPGLAVAGGALITAFVAAIGPLVLAYINKWGDKRIIELQYQVDTLKGKADQADKEREEKEEAKREVIRYQERLRSLEDRVSRNTMSVETVKNVLRSDVLTGSGIQLSPVASIVTDAYGEILTASGQVEFILHAKPEDIIGHNIREYIPKPLHPDPVNHESRSFNPNIEFDDKTFSNVNALTKEGHKVAIDVMLTRWFEKGQRGTIAGVRFGKLIRKHNPNATGLADPFPPIDDLIPGIPREELSRNSDLIAENNQKLDETNAKLGEIISVQSGTQDAHS